MQVWCYSDLLHYSSEFPGRGDWTEFKNITVTSWWARWPLKSPASRLITQPFVQAQIKENIKAPRHWPLWGEFTGDRWIPRTKDQSRGKCFHLVTSSGTRACRACHQHVYWKSSSSNNFIVEYYGKRIIRHMFVAKFHIMWYLVPTE